MNASSKLALAALAAGAVGSACAQGYTVDIVASGGGLGIDDRGDIAVSFTSISEAPPYVLVGQTAKVLTNPDPEYGVLLDRLNDRMAGGDCYVSNRHTQACVWTNGSTVAKLLPVPDGTTSSSFGGMNARGVVAGTVRNHPVLWTNGVLSELRKLAGCLSTSANDINDSGVVIGSCSLTYNSSAGLIWNHGVPSFLPSLFADQYEVFPRVVNSAGTAIGTVYEPGARGHAALWKNGTVSELPMLPDTNDCEGFGLDDQETGLGECFLDVWSSGHAVMWRDGQAIDLNDYMPDDLKSLGYVFQSAGSINHAGVILATAVVFTSPSLPPDYYVARLTPTP